jgi:hypothetical protein
MSAVKIYTPTSRDTLLAKPAACGSGCEAAIPAPDASQRRVIAAIPTLMELLAIRLSWHTTPAKSLVIPLQGGRSKKPAALGGAFNFSGTHLK